jgi:hypothetical protein
VIRDFCIAFFQAEKSLDGCGGIQHAPLLSSIFLPQSTRGELDQRGHLATRSSEIPQESLTTYLFLGECNRGHEILHLQVIDEAMV